MAQNMGLITDTWMTNPYMFDPTQLSNAYSNYNNAALPWPPSYNTGAGGPVNAATGQPIQSFQNWQQQNPGGMNINATPTQPQAAAPAPAGLSPGVNPNRAAGALGLDQSRGLLPPGYYGNYSVNPDKGSQGEWAPAYGGGPQQPAQPQQQAAPQAQAGGAPNNWQAAINALANPGKVQTMGANVPLVQGYQPSGGINAAFLQNAQGRPNMNQGFLSALAALQNRPGQ